MGAELLSQEDSVTFGEFVRIAGEARARDNLARGILKARQSQTHHLCPITGNILQEFGVCGELAEEFPGPFHRAKLPLNHRFLLPGPGQAVLADNARDGIVADFEIKLVDQSFGSKASALPQLHDLTFQARGSLVRATFGRPGLFGQGGRFARNSPAQPFADSVARTTKLSCGRLDPMLPGMSHDLLMKPMSICAHAIQFKIAAVHSGRCTCANRSFGLRLRRPRVPSLRSATGSRAHARSRASGPDAAGPQTSLSTLTNSSIRNPLTILIFRRGSRSTQLFPGSHGFGLAERAGGVHLVPVYGWSRNGH